MQIIIFSQFQQRLPTLLIAVLGIIGREYISKSNRNETYEATNGYFLYIQNCDYSKDHFFYYFDNHFEKISGHCRINNVIDYLIDHNYSALQLITRIEENRAKNKRYGFLQKFLPNKYFKYCHFCIKNPQH